MYSLGITPPTILLINLYPSPCAVGFTLITTWPYCPLPPDCRTNFSSILSTGFWIASLNDTCGLPTLAFTLNSLFKRSIIISRWTSPIPEITVWPVSLSTFTLKVGSSSLNLFIPFANWSWSPLETGSIDTETTGSGNSMDSKVTSPFSDKVCPVLTSFNPITATISPALASSNSSLLLACIWRILETLCFSPVFESIQKEPFFKEPEYTLI